METKTFEIIKKNRKYFAANIGHYKCKILIDDNSKSLELGEQELIVDDISVRSKYGTDLIFKLAIEAEEQKNAGICTLRHYRYNKLLVDDCHKLAGKWDAEEKAWIFPNFVSDKVEELDEIFNSPRKTYEILFNNRVYKGQGSVYLFGVLICKATGRDSGAELGDGIAIITGGVRSGGSVKNWDSVVDLGTTLRLELPSMLVDNTDMSSRPYTAITITEI